MNPRLRNSIASVVLVGPLPPPVHGQAVVTAAIAEHLTVNSTPVVIADTSEGEGTRVHRTFRKLFSTVRAGTRIASTRRSAAFISVNSRHGVWLTTALCVVARLWRRPIALHHHLYVHISMRSLGGRALVLAAGRNAIHVVLSSQMVGDLRSAFPEVRRTYVLSNAGFIAPWTSEDARRRTSPIIGHLSNLSDTKGITDVVEFAVAAYSAEPHTRLVIAGPITDEIAEHEIAKAQRLLGDSFEYLGAVDGVAKSAFYSHITHFILPSKMEASPLVILEALSAGIPVIATAVGAIPDLVPPIAGVCIPSDRRFTISALEWFLADLDNPIDRLAIADWFRSLAAESTQQLDNLVIELGVSNERDLA